MTNSAYQYNYTDNDVAKVNMYDKREREGKAKKIIAVLSDYYGSISDLSVLDMSCSTGYMTRFFSYHFCYTTGIDIDRKAVEFAKQNNSENNITYAEMDAMNTGFTDNSFDVVVCNQMYEHVADANILLREIHRILKPGGVCYFGATSRLKINETHYGTLPFLSYFPKYISNMYLRLLKKSDYYYETLYSYWGLNKLVSQFKVTDYTLRIVSDPEKYSATDLINNNILGNTAKYYLAKTGYYFLPGYVWLLKKEKN